MPLDIRAFSFIISLAAVVNGLGIVVILKALAENLKGRSQAKVVPYWVFALWLPFQFLMHVLLWWSLWNARLAETISFLVYLYLLIGPILLYLGTSLLVPATDDQAIELRAHFYSIRALYFTISAIVWLWIIFLIPVLIGSFAPTLPLLIGFFVMALTLRFTANPKIHAALAIASWLLLMILIAMFAMEFGGIAEDLQVGTDRQIDIAVRY